MNYKKYKNTKFNVQLSTTQKLFISLVLTLIIIYFEHDRLKCFFESFKAKENESLIFLVIFFIFPFMAIATSKGIAIYYTKEKWTKIIKSIVFSFLFCICSIIIFFTFIEFSNILTFYIYYVLILSLIFIFLNITCSKSLPYYDKNEYLSIWGPQHSGKTVYLAILIHELISNKNNDWEINIDDAKPIIPVLDSIKSGKWPASTFMKKLIGKDSLTWKIIISKISDSQVIVRPVKYILDVADTSGQYFEQYDKEEFSNDTYLFFQRVSKSAGLILTISSTVDRKDEAKKILYASLNKIKLQYKKKIQVPVAVCLSKVDKIYYEYEKVNKNPEKLFVHVYGQDVLDMIKQYCENYKFFCFSSIGVKKDLESNKMISRIQIKNFDECPPEDGNIEPFGVIEPLNWILKQGSKNK